MHALPGGNLAGVHEEVRIRVLTSHEMRRNTLDPLATDLRTEPPEPSRRLDDLRRHQPRWIGSKETRGGMHSERSTGRCQVFVFVTASPHVELTPYLREQAVSVTMHRFGTPFTGASDVVTEIQAPSSR